MAELEEVCEELLHGPDADLLLVLVVLGVNGVDLDEKLVSNIGLLH